MHQSRRCPPLQVRPSGQWTATQFEKRGEYPTNFTQPRCRMQTNFHSTMLQDQRYRIRVISLAPEVIAHSSPAKKKPLGTVGCYDGDGDDDEDDFMRRLGQEGDHSLGGGWARGSGGRMKLVTRDLCICRSVPMEGATQLVYQQRCELSRYRAPGNARAVCAHLCAAAHAAQDGADGRCGWLWW